MKSRRDHAQAHAYVMGRLSSALVHGEPDAHETPLRRTTIGVFSGLVIGALLVGGFLVFGLIFPSAKAGSLNSADMLVDQQTGTRYLFAGGALHPVLNWASARLLLGRKPTLQTVPDATLAGLQQGQPWGIVGAPDSLPAAGALNRGDWLVCAATATGGPGTGHSAVSVAIGYYAGALPLPGSQAVLVQAPDGTRYLLWNGHRMRIDAPWITDALGLGSAPVVQVALGWLNAVPAGPDLYWPTVPGLGGPGPVLDGHTTRVGQVLVVANVGTTDAYYLARAGGVTPISRTQAALELTDPASTAAYGGGTIGPVGVSAAAIATTPVVHQPLAGGSGFPAAPPKASSPASPDAVCMDYPGGGGAPTLVFAAPLQGAPSEVGAPGVTASPGVANEIGIAPGDGALVRPQASPDVGGDSYFLVTGGGVKFPVPTSKDLSALGYRVADAVSLPAALLGFLPTGPSLDASAISTPSAGVPSVGIPSLRG